MVAVASLFAPARVWSANSAEIGFSLGLLSWFGMKLGLSFLVWSLLRRVGASRTRLYYGLFWMLLAEGSVGVLSASVPGGYWTLAAAVLVLGWTSYRLGNVQAFRHFTLWTVVVALLIPIALFLTTAVVQPASQLLRAQGPSATEFLRTPDVVILILDAYGSDRVLREFYDIDTDDSLLVFEESGIRVAREAYANYPLTHYSLGSFLEMGYLVREGMRLGRPEWKELLRIINGDSALVKQFKSQGYEFTLVESGWSGIHCGSYVDHCIRGEWFDEATELAVERSLFGFISGSVLTNATAAGTLSSIRFLREDIRGLVENGRQDLVFAHLMIPHPPLLVDRACEYRWDPDLDGTTIAWSGLSHARLDKRKRAYLAQVDCAQSVIQDVATQLRDDAILVAIGDHGPDSRAQLGKEPSAWDARDIRERFGVLVLSNAAGCGMAEVKSLVNVGRSLISCLTDEYVELLEDRIFLAVEGKESIDDNTHPVLEVHLRHVMVSD